ncbi:MAG: hypothetical protein IKK49_08035 [Clostridia bacterium]|nr:hypothetical protein [Clostridia bacterium]MBQ7101817.1 hypothetical protein [Clostridia bacterium]MBR3755024.1 hypothetical protein [Clostridia bacterium]
MKKLLKYYSIISALLILLTAGTAAFITAGEESAAMTKGIQIKKHKLTAEAFGDELEKIEDVIFSFLPFRE